MFIFCMSHNQRQIINKLENVADEIVEHIIKLYLYPNSTYRNHWISEIYELLHSIPKIKK